MKINDTSVMKTFFFTNKQNNLNCIRKFCAFYYYAKYKQSWERGNWDPIWVNDIKLGLKS